MKTTLFLILLSTLIISCNHQNKTTQSENLTISAEKKKQQTEIIEQYVTNCAQKYNYNYDMSKWQNCLDKGLEIDSTVAYLWQQKAMPYFKAKKYEIGMAYIDKAVIYNRESWQPYRAFIKCIFAKTHKEAILDFEDCKKRFGNNYVMNHTYDFYIGLSYLQLNEYEKAEKLFENYVREVFDELGEDWVNPTALFYLGISKYELKKYEEAIVQFDRALVGHPDFADAKYYKAVCFSKLGKKEMATTLYKEYVEDAKNGYTMNEDNVIYEVYPYQRKWMGK